jgi:hypothetical protein
VPIRHQKSIILHHKYQSFKHFGVLMTKNLFNPRLMSYLCAYKALSTTVESALQNHLFMQNEPNFRKSQMNLVVWEKTKPNEPKRTQFQKGQNERNVLHNSGL